MYPGRNFPPRRQNRRENVNESIRAREVRAVFPDGTNEVMPTAAALRKAQELGLDLVLIAPTAVPPVAKAVDFGHYQYEQKKKQHDAKKKPHDKTARESSAGPAATAREALLPTVLLMGVSMGLGNILSSGMERLGLIL